MTNDILDYLKMCNYFAEVDSKPKAVVIDKIKINGK